LSGLLAAKSLSWLSEVHRTRYVISAFEAPTPGTHASGGWSAIRTKLGKAFGDGPVRGCSLGVAREPAGARSETSPNRTLAAPQLLMLGPQAHLASVADTRGAIAGTLRTPLVQSITGSPPRTMVYMYQMAQDQYNLLSLILGGIGAVISLAVGIVVFWYTRETQRLRMQSEQQTSVLRDQLGVSQRQADLFAEQVRSVVQPFVMCEIASLDVGGGNFQPGHPMRAVRSVYRGILWNPTDRVAHNLRVLIRDPCFGYFWSYEPPVLRKIGESEEWFASGPVDGEQALHLLEKVYGDQRIRWYMKALEQNKNQDYVAVFFCDVNGTVYASLSLISKPVANDQVYKLRMTQILRPFQP
jgi:hypothetical protein